MANNDNSEDSYVQCTLSGKGAYIMRKWKAACPELSYSKIVPLIAEHGADPTSTALDELDDLRQRRLGALSSKQAELLGRAIALAKQMEADPSMAVRVEKVGSDDEK